MSSSKKHANPVDTRGWSSWSPPEQLQRNCHLKWLHDPFLGIISGSLTFGRQSGVRPPRRIPRINQTGLATNSCEAISVG